MTTLVEQESTPLAVASADEPPVLAVLRLSRAYGSRLAVNGVECTVRRGDVLGLLGPNGAGKTTTLNILAGALAPTAGKIAILGIDLARQPRAAKQRVGYLPESPPLYPELTVTEYLHFCARLHGLAGRDARKAVGRAVALCALTQAAKQRTGALSKGYRQRVGLAQAILHQPDLLILDEPTAGLDPWQLQEFRALIQELGRTCAVVLSTHLLHEVQSLCTHALILRAGRTVFSGTVAAMRASLESTALRVGLNHPPTEATLKAVPGITRVETLSNTLFRLHHAAGQNPAEEVARQAVVQQWRLYELTAEQPDLEHILLELAGDV